MTLWPSNTPPPQPHGSFIIINISENALGTCRLIEVLLHKMMDYHLWGTHKTVEFMFSRDNQLQQGEPLAPAAY